MYILFTDWMRLMRLMQIERSYLHYEERLVGEEMMKIIPKHFAIKDKIV